MTGDAPLPPLLAMRFRFHDWRRNLGNFSLLVHRDYRGFFVSMKQGGTHWLKHMLSMAITRRYGLPPPRFSHSNEVIGGVRDARPYPQIPRLASSHTIPHPLVGCPAWRRLMRLPPYVVLVRDIRAALVAHYEKWKHRYRCGFSEFLRGDVLGRRFDLDLWWCLRFCNAWGTVARRLPRTTLVVRYEDLAADAPAGLDQINRFLGLGLDQDALAFGIAESTKEKMALKADPATPDGLVVVRSDPRPPAEWFGEGDRAWFGTVCRRLLRADFGYDYTDWTPGRGANPSA